ncbi:MAG: AsmA family protein [Bdellovibrionales bacterium]|nr:AsmA family protein [Bdellovibrionales bacterium]
MRKAIIILFVVLLLAVGGALTYLFTQANSIIAKLKPEIEAQGSKALGTDMKLGEMNIQFFPQTAFAIDGVTLQGIKNPDKKLSVNSGKIQVSLLALLSGQVKIDSIVLDGPKIHIHQTKNGIVIDGLNPPPHKKQPGGKKSGDSQEQQAKPQKEKGANTVPGWLNLNLDSIVVRKGSLSFHPLAGAPIVANDVTLKSNLNVTGTRLTLAGLDLSTNVEEMGRIEIDLSQGSADLGSLRGTLKKLSLRTDLIDLGMKANSEITGVKFDGSTTSAEIQSITGDAVHPSITIPSFTLQGIVYNSEGLTLASGKLSSSLQPIGVIETSFHDISLLLPTMRATIGGIDSSLLRGTSSIKGTYNLKEHSGEFLVGFQELKYNEEEFGGDLRVVAKNKQFLVQDAKIKAFGAAIAASGGARPFEEILPYNTKLDLEKLDIQRTLAFLVPNQEAPLTGELTSLHATAEGTLKPDPKRTLIASTDLEIRNGEFKGGNLPALVLKAMKDIPFLNKAVFGSVPEEYQKELDGESTPIKRLVAEAKVQGEVISAQKLELESSLFSLRASGTVGFNGNLDLKTTFRFIPAFSLALTGKMKELRGLLDEEDRLVIPLQLVGTANKPVVLPNIEEIMKLGAGQVVKDKATDLLNKAFGTKKGQPNENVEPSKEQKLMEGVGNLLGF